MKQVLDKFTRDAFEQTPHGRPCEPNARTQAQRQREFRQRQKFNFLISVTGNANSSEACK